MIDGKEFLNIVEAAIPMYFSLAIGYTTMRWLKFFTIEQSAGISRFLGSIAIPLLVFQIVASNNLLVVNLKLFAADSLQKLIFLGVLFLSKLVFRNYKISLDWIITFFSISSLPNTVIIGMPMTAAMYGQQSLGYLIQTLVFQSAIWVNVVVLLFEYRAASLLVAADRMMQVFPHRSTNSVGNGDFSVTEIRVADGGDRDGGSGRRSGVVLETEKDEAVSMEGSFSNKVKAKGTIKLVLYTLWKKIIKNPMTYASLLGIIWSLLSFRFDIKMPTLVANCISTLGDTANAISMLSLGIFMAQQQNFIACSISEAASAMAVRFLVSPILIAILSKLIGLRGIVLHTAVIQAAFPPGVLSFVFAKEYNVHPNIVSTSVVVGMLIAVPILLVYYIILGAIFK